MSNPTRILSLLFIASVASACWPGGLGFTPFEKPAPAVSAPHASQQPSDQEVAAPVVEGTADTPPEAVPPKADTPTPVVRKAAVHAPRRPAKRTPPARRSKPDSCARGTFFDPRGECWSCPSGTHRTVFSVTAKNACEKRLHIKHRPVAGRMNATGIIKTDCKRGWFLHQLSGVCYRCPGGFKRTVFGIDSQQACERWEGPVWTRAKLHKKLTCGDNGNRACTVGERLPSCDEGLKEDRDAVCVPLEPGETPFLAGLGEKSKAIADIGTEACQSILRPLSPSEMPANFPDLSQDCRQRATNGFICEIPGAIDQVSALTDYAANFGKAWETKPCSDWTEVARPLCAAATAALGDAPEVLSCIGAAIEAGALGHLDRGEVCEAAGQVAFQVVVTRKIRMKGKKKKGGKGKGKRKRKGKAGEETRLDQLKRLLVKSGKVTKGVADFSAQLDRIAACRILDEPGR